MTIWFYDCDGGQGVVDAKDYESAKRAAVLDAGRDAGVANVREATASDIAFRVAMGGWMPSVSPNI